jgi:hypothetical protein
LDSRIGNQVELPAGRLGRACTISTEQALEIHFGTYLPANQAHPVRGGPVENQKDQAMDYLQTRRGRFAVCLILKRSDERVFI